MAQKSICDESVFVYAKSSEDWKNTVLPDFIRQFHENDVFNA